MNRYKVYRVRNGIDSPPRHELLCSFADEDEAVRAAGNGYSTMVEDSITQKKLYISAEAKRIYAEWGSQMTFEEGLPG